MDVQTCLNEYQVEAAENAYTVVRAIAEGIRAAAEAALFFCDSTGKPLFVLKILRYTSLASNRLEPPRTAWTLRSDRLEPLEGNRLGAHHWQSDSQMGPWLLEVQAQNLCHTQLAMTAGNRITTAWAKNPNRIEPHESAWGQAVLKILRSMSSRFTESGEGTGKPAAT